MHDTKFLTCMSREQIHFIELVANIACIHSAIMTEYLI